MSQQEHQQGIRQQQQCHHLLPRDIRHYRLLHAFFISSFSLTFFFFSTLLSPPPLSPVHSRHFLTELCRNITPPLAALQSRLRFHATPRRHYASHFTAILLVLIITRALEEKSRSGDRW
jgi:hypothetical protein